jgi:ABC-type nitrate/sulfonate/bicarbonate transport system permease component
VMGVEPRAEPAAGRTPRRTAMRVEARARLVLLALVVLGATAWEIGARTGFLTERFVSTPSAILRAVPELARQPLVSEALLATGNAMLWATIYGVGAGIAAGYLMGFFPSFRRAFYGAALFLLSVPKSIFIPIFLVIFGINPRTAIYYGAFSGLVYVLVNVVSGFDLIEERHLRVATAYRAGLRHRITDVILPASLPGVFNGIWYGLKSGLQGVLILEFFVSVGGLGRVITLYTNEVRTDRVIALVLFVSLVAIVVGQLWTSLETKLARWRPRGA